MRSCQLLHLHKTCKMVRAVPSESSKTQQGDQNEFMYPCNSETTLGKPTCIASRMSRIWTTVWRAKSLQCCDTAKPGCWKRLRRAATCAVVCYALQNACRA